MSSESIPFTTFTRNDTTEHYITVAPSVEFITTHPTKSLLSLYLFLPRLLPPPLPPSFPPSSYHHPSPVLCLPASLPHCLPIFKLHVLPFLRRSLPPLPPPLSAPVCLSASLHSSAFPPSSLPPSRLIIVLINQYVTHIFQSCVVSSPSNIQ